MSIAPRSSFSTDPRLARLSFQARDLLRCIEECFPEILQENGRAPAAPAVLRDKCYKLRTDVMDSHIGRWLKELESNSIVILYQNSDYTAWLTLTDRRGAPRKRDAEKSLSKRDADSIQRSLSKRDAERSLSDPEQSELLPHAGRAEVIPLIHNPAGLSPPDPQKIAAVAAAATSSLDLIARLAAYFPQHDVAKEFDRYFAYRKKLGRPAIASGFAKWMLRAELPLTKPDRQASKRNAEKKVSSAIGDAQQRFLPLLEDEAHERFLNQYAVYKGKGANTKHNRAGR